MGLPAKVGLPGLLGGVTQSAGVTICYVNVSRWGSLLSWSCVHVTKESNEPNTSVSKLTLKLLLFVFKTNRTKTGYIEVTPILTSTSIHDYSRFYLEPNTTLTCYAEVRTSYR